MSGKIHIRERKLSNKLTIKKNIYLNGVWLYRQKTKITTLLLKKWTELNFTGLKYEKTDKLLDIII